MLASDFDYRLPPSRIASRPLASRDDSRLLHLSAGGLMDARIRDLPRLVRPGDVWVLNDTRVIPARLLGRKPSGGQVEILLLAPEVDATVWRAWARANRPLAPGTVVEIAPGFSARVLSRSEREVVIHLQAGDVDDAIERYGHVPLPPYIHRPDDEADRARYQTVYARHPGAVAAPTAGLHLTENLMQAMRRAGAEFVYLTLHVGPGTFQPLQVERLCAHTMHEERYVLPGETAAAVLRARAEGRRVIAVGTTSLRALETSAEGGGLAAGSNSTRLFIYPGYRFRVVDALLTNFHLPRSTLLMLVCALADRRRVLAAYEHAMAHGYRFYSYGDAMFVERLPVL